MRVKHITIQLVYEKEEHFDEVIQLLKESLKDSVTTINWQQGFNTTKGDEDIDNK